MNDFFKVSRKITEWEWFTDGNMLKVWIYLLGSAQYKKTRFEGIELQRGQVIIGRKKLAEKTGLTEQQVRTCINRLKSTNEITIESTNKYSIISIVKYGKYQGADEENNQQINQESNQQTTNKQPTNNQQITTIQERKKERRKETVYIGKSDAFISAFKNFEEMRTKKRKPLTARAKELIMKDLERLADDELTQIAILDKSTKEGWSGVYALKDNDTLPVYNTANNPVMNTDQEEELLSLMGRKHEA